MRNHLDLIFVLSVIILSITSCTNGNKNLYAPLNNPEKYRTGIDTLTIFPIPKEIRFYEGRFILDSNTYIILPDKSGNDDSFLAEMLSGEFADIYEKPVRIVRKSVLPYNDNFILIGNMKNPLVRDYCKKFGLRDKLDSLGDEGYLLRVTQKNIVVAANTGKGALWGLESLRQIIEKDGEGVSVQQMLVKDSPRYPFRGIKLYLPGRENIPFFKRFIKDFAALYKFNKIILELNANMRLESHPELNIGSVKFERHLNFSRLDRPPGMHQEYQNSSHQDNADGEILEKEEVADLVDYMRKFNIEVIPELPSLTHSYYLLFGHEELAENMNQPYPDTYCPLKPEIYKIYFDVLDEYIDVIQPEMIHVGHDEWRMEKDICELCRGKDYGQLFADDLIKIHDYLAKKGIKTAIWGDHLLESVTEKDHQTWKSSAGYQYKIPGALRPEQVLELIPKDIIIFNWFWDEISNDKQLSGFGFQQVYGNFLPEIDKWDERRNVRGVLGGAPSSWAGTTELNIGKDQIYDFLGCANLLWSEIYLPPEKLTFVIEPMIRRIYSDLSGKLLPGDAGSKVTPLDVSPKFNSLLSEFIEGFNSSQLLTGTLKTGNRTFNPGPFSGKEGSTIGVYTQNDNSKSGPVTGIEVNKDVNSIIFLHACAKEAVNRKAYGLIYNFEETAELLGWYEIVYEDGFVETVPLRYGINILDVGWRKRIAENVPPKAKYSQNRYAYQASAVDCSADKSNSLTFFAFEWENTRFGKHVKEINLKPVKNNLNDGNAVILLAVSITEFKKADNSEGTERH